jgi:mannose-6-phosphate isomerase-like protein (cupin superfamily)
MYIKREQMTVEDKENLRGGTGVVKFTNFAPEMPRHTKIFSEIRLPPGASIGYHKHEGETEYYLFLSGTGIINDNGTEYTVMPGDATATGNGNSHSLTNTGKEDLLLHAIIILD